MGVPAIGITGGIGAGKSEALRAFERHGAAVSSSDAVVHLLFHEDEEVRAALRERYGDRLFGAAGEIDRGTLGSIVFNDPDELTWLESLLHPRVVRANLEWRAALAGSEHPPALTVTEVPLLYETGAEERFDQVVVITAPPELRAARTRVRDDGRGRRLMDEDEKVRRADFAYVNDGSVEELESFVAEVVKQVAGESPA